MYICKQDSKAQLGNTLFSLKDKKSASPGYMFISGTFKFTMYNVDLVIEDFVVISSLHITYIKCSQCVYNLAAVPFSEFSILITFQQVLMI